LVERGFAGVLLVLRDEGREVRLMQPLDDRMRDIYVVDEI